MKVMRADLANPGIHEPIEQDDEARPGHHRLRVPAGVSVVRRTEPAIWLIQPRRRHFLYTMLGELNRPSIIKFGRLCDTFLTIG